MHIPEEDIYTAPELRKLMQAARRIGWSVDYDEVVKFIIELHAEAMMPLPDDFESTMSTTSPYSEGFTHYDKDGTLLFDGENLTPEGERRLLECEKQNKEQKGSKSESV